MERIGFTTQARETINELPDDFNLSRTFDNEYGSWSIEHEDDEISIFEHTTEQECGLVATKYDIIKYLNIDEPLEIMSHTFGNDFEVNTEPFDYEEYELQDSDIIAYLKWNVNRIS